ncbi:MAG: IS30 family transposase [Bacilli bacterium]|jgi:IS30 family transposase
MCKNKRLSLRERFIIERELELNKSFKSIANLIDRDCTTISKEIKSHYKVQNTGAYGRVFNNCLFRKTCKITALCSDCYQSKNRLCKNCILCRNKCDKFVKGKCSRLTKPPYVCNGCKDRTKCTLTKNIYDAAYAFEEYKLILSESRSGVTIAEEDIDNLNSILEPLICKQNQSIHHAYINNTNKIMYSEKTIYKLIDLGVLKIKNIDLPRKVRFRNRRKNQTVYKVDKQCLEGRRYEDFLEFIEHNPDTPLVQMDTVEGRKRGKVLLTIHFVSSSFMLAFIRDYNDAQSVIDIFNNIFQLLGIDKFKKLFPVILTDNGSEFSNPTEIEFDMTSGELRTNVFYCHPSSPYEKGSCEVNHEFLRRILPKGKSFDELTQTNINLIMSHINSYKRKKLNNKPPYLMFSTIYGKDTIDKLGIQEIEPNKVSLSKSLLKK